MIGAKMWSVERGYRGTRLQYAQTLLKDREEAAKGNLAKTWSQMSDAEKCAKYSETIRDTPIPSDYSILKVAKQFYGIEVDPNNQRDVQLLRYLLYDSKNPPRGNKAQIQKQCSPGKQHFCSELAGD